MKTLDSGIRELAAGKPVKLRIRGQCMGPLIEEADEVEIVPARIYLPGDIIVFRSGAGKLMLRRLLGYRWHQRQWKLVTRGDAARWHDEPVAWHQVLGKVSGGDGSPGAVPVPFLTRIRALIAFLQIAGRRLVQMVLQRRR